jgi:hypothetical protein
MKSKKKAKRKEKVASMTTESDERSKKEAKRKEY